MRNKTARHRVAVAANPGAPIFELAVPCEVFGIDRRDITDDWYDFQICPAVPNVRLAGGFIAAQDASLDDLATADTVIIPACGDVHAAAPKGLVTAILQAHARGARIASICSGAFVLAEAGLLDGRRATTHWMHAEELAKRYPKVKVDASILYIQDGAIWTSAGTSAGLDLCLELVRRDHGSAVAAELACRIVMPPHREGGQAQYVRHQGASPGGTDQQAGLQQWARENLADVSVLALARKAGISPRTLVRQFRSTTAMAPQQWLNRERILLAQHLLESTDLTIDSIAARSGFGTATNLRQRFRRDVGISPAAYRRAFFDDHLVPFQRALGAAIVA